MTTVEELLSAGKTAEALELAAAVWRDCHGI
jgi:hypothetical protein